MTNPLSKILNGEDQNDQYNTLTNTQVGELNNMSNKPYESLTDTDRTNYDYASKNSGYKNENYKGNETPEADPYEQFKNPKTGEVMSPEEYAVYLGNKVPGSVTKYAGDAMTDPNQTSEQLTNTATNLNNERNDIATGTTDTYKVGNKSGIAYSPAQLKAIESAYAGVYDPALNDVFSRLKEKQAEDQQVQDREDIIFKTNEDIRKYKATVAANKTSGSGDENSSDPVDIFTTAQLNKAAGNGGFSTNPKSKTYIGNMDPDLVNFFYSPPNLENPDGKIVSYPQAMNDWFKEVENGNASVEETKDKIVGSLLPDVVKAYYINLVPQVSEEEVDNTPWLRKIFGSIWDKIKNNIND